MRVPIKFIVDSLGNATLFGTLTVSDGAGSLNSNSALSKFMIVVSPEADLTTIGSENKVALRSTMPHGFAVVAKEKSGEPASAVPSPSNAQVEPTVTDTPEYDVPLLAIGSLRLGTNTTMRAGRCAGPSACPVDTSGFVDEGSEDM